MTSTRILAEARIQNPATEGQCDKTTTPRFQEAAILYPIDSDYVFASPTMRGTQPYWPDNLMKRYIRPVAREAGINKNIGWHTFRHSFGTSLKANGEDVKTIQELLRHANSRVTLDVYTQAVNSNKRAAQSKVVRMMVSNVGTVLSDVGTTDFGKVAVNAR